MVLKREGTSRVKWEIGGTVGRWDGPLADVVRVDIRRGAAVTSDGVRHQMRTAFPSRSVSKRLGISKNRFLRVWCECHDSPLHTPGSIPSGNYWNPDRTVSEILADPRRLWSYDSLGVVDVLDAGSALDLFRAHVEDHERRTR